MNNAKMNNGGPAFLACTYNHTLEGQVVRAREYGMTLRDYFAAKAMQAFLSQSHHGPDDWTHMGHGWGEDCANQLNAHSKATAHTLADFAYQIADAMLAERDKTK